MQNTELIIRNARLRDNREQFVDIKIGGGQISEIGVRLSSTA